MEGGTTVPVHEPAAEPELPVDELDTLSQEGHIVKVVGGFICM